MIYLKSSSQLPKGLELNLEISILRPGVELELHLISSSDLSRANTQVLEVTEVLQKLMYRWNQRASPHRQMIKAVYRLRRISKISPNRSNLAHYNSAFRERSHGHCIFNSSINYLFTIGV